MKLAIAAITLYITSVLAAPAASSNDPTSKTYLIAKFTTHKSDGTKTSKVSFHIQGDFGLDVECGQYAINGAQPDPDFEENKFYTCGPESDYQQKQFQWTYQSGDAESGKPGKLTLWQQVSKFKPQLGGSTSFSEPDDCRKERSKENKKSEETVCTTPNTAAIDLKSPEQ